MRLLILVIVGPLYLATCLTALAAETDKKPTAAEAKSAAEKWLDDLGERALVLTEVVKKGGFTVSHADSALGRITKFNFQQPGWWLSFAFQGEHSAKTPLKTLQKRFLYIALDQLPTPGLDLPGWEVRPRTPTSSIKKGVEILAYGDGQIKLRVRTEFFALGGRDPSVLVPADAPAPPGSYFQIRRKFPLDLTMEAPFAFE